MSTKIKIKGSTTTTPTNLEHREPSVSFTDGRCKLLIGNVFGDAVELTDAVNIKNTPAGNIASSTVQNAINELDTEKLAKSSNLSDVANRQTSLNNITNVTSATNEYVLTKDTETGNAIFKPSVGGGSASTLETTSTTGSTTTLTSSSANIQRFTGTAGQILVLPDATTLTNAKSFDIINDCTTATGAISIRTNGGAYLTLIPQTGKATIILKDNTTSAGNWSVEVSVPNISGLTIINSANSFTAGQYLTNGASGYILAKSDTSTTLPAVARVICANANQYAIFTSGFCSGNLGLDSGLNTNTSYIVSNVTAGAMMAYPSNPSDGQLLQPVFEASSTNSGILNILGIFTWNVGGAEATTSNRGIIYLPKSITISNNTTNPNTQIDFTAGNFIFSDGSGQAIASAMTKTIQSSGSWSAGTGGNMLLSGAKEVSSTYHLFAIYNPTTNTSDFGAIKGIAGTIPNPTSVLPSGYTKYKRVGSILTDVSSNIRAFIQRANYFKYTTAISDLNIIFVAGATTPTVSTPLGINTLGLFNIGLDILSTSNGGNVWSYIIDFDQINTLPTLRHASVNVCKMSSFSNSSSASASAFTNLNSQVEIWNGENVSNTSNASISLLTLGFIDINL